MWRRDIKLLTQGDGHSRYRLEITFVPKKILYSVRWSRKVRMNEYTNSEKSENHQKKLKNRKNRKKWKKWKKVKICIFREKSEKIEKIDNFIKTGQMCGFSLFRSFSQKISWFFVGQGGPFSQGLDPQVTSPKSPPGGRGNRGPGEGCRGAPTPLPRGPPPGGSPGSPPLGGGGRQLFALAKKEKKMIKLYK